MSRIFPIVIIALLFGVLLHKFDPILLIHRAVLVLLAVDVRLRYVRVVFFVQIFLRLKVLVPLSEPSDRMYGSIHMHGLIIVPIVDHQIILGGLTVPVWGVSGIVMVVFLVFITELVEDVKLQILPVGFLALLLSMMRYLRQARSLSDLKSVKFVALV
jgi:hypothetical protein